MGLNVGLWERSESTVDQCLGSCMENVNGMIAGVDSMRLQSMNGK